MHITVSLQNNNRFEDLTTKVAQPAGIGIGPTMLSWRYGYGDVSAGELRPDGLTDDLRWLANQMRIPAYRTAARLCLDIERGPIRSLAATPQQIALIGKYKAGLTLGGFMGARINAARAVTDAALPDVPKYLFPVGRWLLDGEPQNEITALMLHEELAWLREPDPFSGIPWAAVPAELYGDPSRFVREVWAAKQIADGQVPVIGHFDLRDPLTIIGTAIHCSLDGGAAEASGWIALANAGDVDLANQRLQQIAAMAAPPAAAEVKAAAA